ncbi:head GIN domain-containing protein [Flavobacterium sp. J27]|uniref:head GIN domain-containing protein n=1 Tax=Flavobacterium sp. J27 TaxID=2060419 RepID=UPI00102F6996|nr:head GIN domain-containing protein [Flavobacterium sp. J27]
MIKNTCCIILLLIVSSCGISEDCFKGNGNQIIQSFPLEGFHKIEVHDGVALLVKEGPEYEVKIETRDNILNNIEVKLENDMLIIKDNSTCNLTRDYGLTKAIITIPNGINLPIIPELELHSKTEQNISSEGPIHSPIVRLFSLDESDASGTGDFYLEIENTQVVIESNTVSNFFISGLSEQMLLNFYYGNGRFHGENLSVKNINIFQRGSNDMIVKPIEKIEGTIYATGNVILKHIPPLINVEEKYTGRLIY